MEIAISVVIKTLELFAWFYFGIVTITITMNLINGFPWNDDMEHMLKVWEWEIWRK